MTDPILRKPEHNGWHLPPQTRSNLRLAVVAGTLIATIGVLIFVSLQARNAEAALDESAERTLRDYAGYASRTMGAEVLRRFSEQRSGVFAPVAGISGQAGAGPSVQQFADRNKGYFVELGIANAPGSSFFRMDFPSRAFESVGLLPAPLRAQLMDTIAALQRSPSIDVVRNIMSLKDESSGVIYSVAYSPQADPGGRTRAIYGYTYERAPAVSMVAERVFRETPLLPMSYTGSRWSYDSIGTGNLNLNNGAFLDVRISDRNGNSLWASRADSSVVASRFSSTAVLSTSSGGMVIRTSIRAATERSLIPEVVARAQRWSARALLILCVLFIAVSLIALQGERLGAHARRREAMQQLALGLRHELNNALASVMLNAELLGEEQENESQRDRVHAIVEQSERMRGVLRRLEKIEGLDVVPYLDKEFMVDLSSGAA